MSNTLTARVKLDISDAERKLSQLERRINQINSTLNNSGNSGNKINQQLSKAVNNTQKLDSANKKAANSANTIAKGYKNANSAVSVLTKNLRTLVSTYVGIMGAKAVTGAADTLTGAQNQLNYINAQQLGDKGFTTDKSGNQTYSVDTINATQEALDKMYAASMRARTSYADMQKNVGKTMMLAGDAFQNNTDNAIRFQEIMAKAYKLGGQSAAEQASSMYQLVQALGSGRLQGDELRSLIEGAPKAATMIEDFAQKLYGTKDALKDMASQGLITSDIVVAAIMNGGEAIDTAFAQTKATFADTMKAIASMANKAFEPVLERLTNFLNSDVGQSIVQGIGKAFEIIANGVLWVMDIVGTVFGWLTNIIGSFFSWCKDNWYWLQWVVYAVIACIVVYLGILAAHLIWVGLQAIWTGIKMFWAFITGMQPIYWIILLIGAAVAAIVWLANTTGSACEFITSALIIVALAILAIGIITGSTALLIVSIVVAVIAVILAALMEFGQQIFGWIYRIASLFANLIQFICNAIVTGFGLLVNAVANLVTFIGNLFAGCFNWITTSLGNLLKRIGNVIESAKSGFAAVGSNIGIAFHNGCENAKARVSSLISWALSALNKLATPINALLEKVGKEPIKFGGSFQGYSANKKEYKDWKGAFSSGYSTYSYKDASAAFSKGWNTYDRIAYTDTFNNLKNTFGTAFEDGWWDNSYNKGAAVGLKVENKLNSIGNSLKDKIAGFDISDLTSLFGKFHDKFMMGDTPTAAELGIDPFSPEGVLNPDKLNNLANKGGSSDKGSKLPNPNDPALGVGGSYDPSKVLKNIKDDVGSIADSVDLTEDDLEYLRKIADMEWKKEFTTATIHVDMSNYNTVNGDGDLDGIVTRLADKLYEELDMVANGVYA